MRAKLVLLFSAFALMSPVALAQQTKSVVQAAGAEKRIEKLEKEMKAVQRKVFPGADGGFFEPEIQPETKKTEGGGTTPALSDLTARVDALESQLAALTGQSEQNGFRIKQLEAQFAAFKTEMAAKSIHDPILIPDSSKPAAGSATAPVLAAKPPAVSAAKPAVKPTVVAAKPPAPKAETVTPISTSPSRLAAVKAVVIPNTGDAAEDAYIYAYRLWTAKLHPEAQAQLRKFIENYPKHRRVSYAQNLIGRSYLDEGKPNLAITAFYRNFKDLPRGERAPDSLYFMATALMKMNKYEDACTTLAELDNSYGKTLSATLRKDSDAAKLQAKCS
jgi:TolA-binding protein